MRRIPGPGGGGGVVSISFLVVVLEKGWVVRIAHGKKGRGGRSVKGVIGDWEKKEKGQTDFGVVLDRRGN